MRFNIFTWNSNELRSFVNNKDKNDDLCLCDGQENEGNMTCHKGPPPSAYIQYVETERS